MRRNDAQFEEFHGREATGVKGFNFHVPRKLIYLGEATAIEYRCNKLHGGGDGKKATYRHEFKPGSILCMDEVGGRQLFIFGARIRVDSAGIRH